MDDKILPTSEGLLRCLQALADETASLGLLQTHVALQQAIRTCNAERLLLRSTTQNAYLGPAN
jgi:hypothetical protein